MFVSNILLGVVALIALATSEKSTSFASVFPNQHALKSGQKATLLIGFKNIAQIQQKIVSVKGYFTSKSAFDKISFNISEFQYESTVDQGDEITIPYPFIPFMEPGSVGLVVLVSHYDHSETLSTSVAFQDLITIVASDSLFDLERFKLINIAYSCMQLDWPVLLV